MGSLQIACVVSGNNFSFAALSATGEYVIAFPALAERICSVCHAIGKTGASPHAPAPAFRDLGNRVDLDDFAHRLGEGLTSGHPGMPTFRFTREDARALTAYLRSIQAQ